MAGVMVGLMVVGTVMSAAGMYQQAQAQAQQQEYAARMARLQAEQQQYMAEYNAKVLEQDAGEVRKAAAYQAEMDRDKLRRLVGQQRLAYAVSGVELSSGSPLETMMQQTRDSELDIQNNLYNSELQARSYEKKAILTRYGGQNDYNTGMATASAYESTASSTRTAGMIGTAGTILSGAGKIYGAYGGYSTAKNKYFQDMYNQ